MKKVRNVLINDFPNINTNNAPHWSTIYDFFRKLVKYDIINITFKQTVNKYLLHGKPCWVTPKNQLIIYF